MVSEFRAEVAWNIRQIVSSDGIWPPLSEPKYK